jgi:2-methylcitrate dehydratase PrpD
MTAPLTRILAQYASSTSSAEILTRLSGQAERLFLNWLGCAIGGCNEPVTARVLATLGPLSGKPEATMIGAGKRLDCLTAAYLNSLSSGVHTYDETHLKTVNHPSGPVVGAALALAQRLPCTGRDFLAGIAAGAEIACRIGNALVTPPAHCHVGFSMTGLTGGIGAAAACGRLLQFDEARMISALGTAAIQAAGFRETHQSQAAYLVTAQGGRSGLVAALTAQHDIDAIATSLEGPNGFLSVFASVANVDAALEGLGEHFEIADLAFKPYPCGVIVHAAIDACLEASQRIARATDKIEKVELFVPPLAIKLGRQTDPQTPFEAQVSLNHWAAVALRMGAAGLAQSRVPVVTDPEIVALRRRIGTTADQGLAADATTARIHLTDGSQFDIHVPHCRGSRERPLTDSEIDAKFIEQAVTRYTSQRAEVLRSECRALASSKDVGAWISSQFDEPVGSPQRQ